MKKQYQTYIGFDPASGKDYSCYVYIEDGRMIFRKNPYPLDNITPTKALQRFVNMIPRNILKPLIRKWF